MSKARNIVENTRVLEDTKEELGYMDGVTSNVQTQLNAKAPTAALDLKADVDTTYTKVQTDAFVVSLTTKDFQKPTTLPLFTKVSASSISIPIGLIVGVNGSVVRTVSAVTLSLNTSLDTGSKAEGTDYYVYVKADGTFYISANKAITADRLIGGLHYGLTAEAEALTGNKTEADMVAIRGINAYSFWDLKWLPSNGIPEGKVYIGAKWYDIYLMDENYALRGYSQAGGKIAAGTTEYGRGIPKIPSAYGGNGTLTYGKFTWFNATEIAKAASADLIPYDEFAAIAYGVSEGKSSSTDAYEVVMGKIEHYPHLTSKYGLEQVTGTQYIWGKNLANGYGTSDFTWMTTVTDSRGQINASSNAPVAVALGGHRVFGVIAGSRCSSWDSFVWHTYWNVGARFVCDHLKLV